MVERFDIAEEFTNVMLEVGLLHTLATQPDVYWDVVDYLTFEVFTGERQAVYESIVRAIEDGKPIPEVPPAEPIQDPVEAAKTLLNLFQQRQVAALSFSVLQRIREGIDSTQLIAEMEEGLAQIQQSVRELHAGQAVSILDLLPETITEAEKRRQAVKEKGTAAIGLPTGIKTLDKMLGGLQTGIHLLAARPGEGKTTFVLQCAMATVETGFPVLFVSFEETLQRLALKAICSKAQLEAKPFADGYGDIQQLRDAAATYGPQLGALYFIEGSRKLTVSQLKAKALQAMNKTGTDKCLIVVDYLQRWASNIQGADEYRLRVSSLISEIREMSLRLDSPVIVVSSQNRDGQGAPDLTSFKESGDIEYSADTAMFLVRDNNKQATPPNRAVSLSVAKNRYGDIGKIELFFRPDIGRFWEVAQSEY